MSYLSTGLVSDSTRFIRVLTDEYNLSLADIQRIHRDVMWGSEVTEEFMASLGYAVVHPREPYGSGRYTEITPVEEAGLYYQNWTVREETPEELEISFTNAREIALSTVNSFATQAIARGVIYDFDDRFLTVQIRDQDRVNIIGMALKAEREPAIVQTFRTAENIMVPVTKSQIIEISDQAYDTYVAIKAAEWELVDAIRSATTISEIPAVPDTLRQFYETNAGLSWVEQTA